MTAAELQMKIKTIFIFLEAGRYTQAQALAAIKELANQT